MKKIGVSFLLICLMSCGKGDEIAPVITLTSPDNNQVFSAGQTVNINATVTDETGVHMVHVIVTDNTGGHLLHAEEHPDGKTFTVNKSFVTQAGKTYTIQVDATDHAENLTNKQVTVSAN